MNTRRPGGPGDQAGGDQPPLVPLPRSRSRWCGRPRRCRRERPGRLLVILRDGHRHVVAGFEAGRRNRHPGAGRLAQHRHPGRDRRLLPPEQPLGHQRVPLRATPSTTRSCTIAADGSIQPYLAESLTPNATFDIWTLTLRPGIKFNDGSDLTATVIVANSDALRTSAAHRSVPLQIIADVEAADPLHGRVHPHRSRSAVLGRTGRHPGRLRGRPGHDRRGQGRQQDTHPGRYRTVRRTPTGSPTTTSPPPAIRTTGVPGSPTSTRSPSSPFPTRPSARPRSTPAGST